MSESPRSPRLMKGALIAVDPANPLASVVLFQYNPDTLTRSITPNMSGGSGGSGQSQGEALRLLGPPEETITLDVEIDATDQLESAQPQALALGIHPALAALEMLVYPKSSVVIISEALAAGGFIEVVPPEAPLTIFVWGPARVVPVRVSSVSITEEAFDTALNPIRARASLTLRVLNYRDLGLASAGGALFMAHQIVKETMATMNGVAALSGSISVSAGIGG
jgi:hypothetical protein